eukprot:4133463-Prymnesium_polylepis.1
MLTERHDSRCTAPRAWARRGRRRRRGPRTWTMRASTHAGPERMIACPSLLQRPWMSPVPWGHLGRLQG